MKLGFWHFLKQYGWLSLISGALLITLVIMSQILQNASSFADTYSTLVFIAIIGVGFMLVVLAKTLWQLWRQYQLRTPGIKITIRLTIVSTLMIGVPTAIVFYFSLNFIQQGINQWFDVKTETALENASDLARMTLDNQTRERLNLTSATVQDNNLTLLTTPIIEVSRLRALLDAREVSLYQSNQQLIAFSSQEVGNILPNAPADHIFQQIRQHKSYAAIETQPGATTQDQFIRIIVPFSSFDLTEQYALQAIFAIPQDITSLADSVASATSQYKELSYLKGPLTTSFILILTTVLLLTMVTAILFTIQAVQNFTRPIRTLAQGTQAVSKGDYSIKMPVNVNDEFGELTQSFNDMIQRISQARNEIKIGNQQTEVQKLYLQTIIKNLSSGVVTLDMNKRLRSTNDASQAILHADFTHHQGKHIKDIIKNPNCPVHLAEFFNHLLPMLERGTKPWRLEINIASNHGQKILMIHGSTLPSVDQKIGGYVIVIDDITTLVQAQLNAAWSDVARRLAHEIKNPLTPIQLSAERLNFKLHDKLDNKDQQLLQRMTETIIEQVDSMQTLVQAFSDYANTPEMSLQMTDINQLISKLAEMYNDPNEHWTIETELCEECPIILVDTSRLRQLFHNLIKNAIEATENTILPKIRITTGCIDADFFTITLCDNGPGIAEEAQNWIFEPYSTNKPKGSGLGLAIVRKIVEEHHGNIELNTSTPQGTCFIIKLPIYLNELLDEKKVTP